MRSRNISDRKGTLAQFDHDSTMSYLPQIATYQRSTNPLNDSVEDSLQRSKSIEDNNAIMIARTRAFRSKVKKPSMMSTISLRESAESLKRN